MLADLGEGRPEIILMATGSEVSLIVKAGERLAAEGTAVRLVSFPSWELFEDQDEAYRNEVLPPDIKPRLAVEAGISQGWHRWTGDGGRILALDRFGASAPGKIVFENLGLTADHVVELAAELLNK